MTSTIVRLIDGGEMKPREDVADALLVGNNLRFATMEGEPHTIENGKITKGKSQEPMTVEVKNYATDSVETFDNIRFVKSEDNMVFISGPEKMDRIVGSIKRIKRMNLPQ